MTRAEWKAWYRRMRINRREHGKALLDLMLYGTAYLVPDPKEPSCIQHVPALDVLPDHVKAELIDLGGK